MGHAAAREAGLSDYVSIMNRLQSGEPSQRPKLVDVVHELGNIVGRLNPVKPMHCDAVRESLAASCNEPWAISSTDYTVSVRLGSGACGEVYKGNWRGSDVAVKKLTVDGAAHPREIAEDFAKELKVVVGLRHPHICSMLAACLEEGKLAMILELADCDMEALFREREHKKLWLTQRSAISQMAIDVARGIGYLHGFAVPLVHRDLNPANCLVFRDYAIKVADFGLTRARKAGASMTTCGTPLFVAPEMIAGRDDYDEKVDVYAFGVLLACLFERKSNPYPKSSAEKGLVEFLSQVSEGVVRPELGPSSKMVSGLCSRCWDADPQKRPSFEVILAELKELHQARTTDAASRHSVQGGLPEPGSKKVNKFRQELEMV